MRVALSIGVTILFPLEEAALEKSHLREYANEPGPARLADSAGSKEIRLKTWKDGKKMPSTTRGEFDLGDDGQFSRSLTAETLLYRGLNGTTTS